MLSPQQIVARAGKLTASRVACLMGSDGDAVMRLWREMIGEEQPEDLSHVWAVQLGAVTEQLNLDWYEMALRNPTSHRGEVVVHPFLPWAACTLDGWDDVLNCPIECKHVGGREPLEVIRDRYQPQMQWQMEVTGAEQCALSVIMGANEPVILYVPADDEYVKELLKRGEQFMGFVERREPPVALAPVPPPVDPTKVYDMQELGNNEWAVYAAEWIATKPFADKCDEAKKILKSIVPNDAQKCHGYGVMITRNRAGHLNLRESSK